MKVHIFAAALALAAMASGAQAGTITFDSLTYGTNTAGVGATEGAFDITVASGALFANNLGHPGANIEGDLTLGGGVLNVIASDGGRFTFDGLDYAAWSGSGQGSQTLVVRGWLGGSELATDSFLLANTSSFALGYSNWTFFASNHLAGLSIDKLSIELGAGDGNFLQAVDNVSVSSVSAVPEPATWAMMISGFGLVGATLRRRASPVAL